MKINSMGKIKIVASQIFIEILSALGQDKISERVCR